MELKTRNHVFLDLLSLFQIYRGGGKIGRKFSWGFELKSLI